MQSLNLQLLIFIATKTRLSINVKHSQCITEFMLEATSVCIFLHSIFYCGRIRKNLWALLRYKISKIVGSQRTSFFRRLFGDQFVVYGQRRLENLCRNGHVYYVVLFIYFVVERRSSLKGYGFIAVALDVLANGGAIKNHQFPKCPQLVGRSTLFTCYTSITI